MVDFEIDSYVTPNPISFLIHLFKTNLLSVSGSFLSIVVDFGEPGPYPVWLFRPNAVSVCVCDFLDVTAEMWAW